MQNTEARMQPAVPKKANCRSTSSSEFQVIGASTSAAIASTENANDILLLRCPVAVDTLPGSIVGDGLPCNLSQPVIW
jgi:hypothetical protein